MVNKMLNKEKILKNFMVEGEIIDVKPFGSGHINDTLLVTVKQDKKEVKYILRKINCYVFKQPELIIENTINVTNHIRQKLLEINEPDLNRKVFTLLLTKYEKYYHIDEAGDYWCLVVFIDHAYTIDSVENENQAFEAARAYGKFQKYLSDFDTSQCHITIKDFHNLSNRINAFENSINRDPKNRVISISKEILLAKKYGYLNDEFITLKGKNLLTRITHNDTKINNIMLNNKTNEGLCVIDLDTVMPGIILNDFGDMVRTFTSPALEDDKDIAMVRVRLSIFDALVKGYLTELNGYLTKDEVGNLVLGSKIIVFEQAIRFLTDYINGDVYYKTEYDIHNLNRAKNQFALLASIEEQSSEMENIIINYSRQNYNFIK